MPTSHNKVIDIPSLTDITGPEVVEVELSPTGVLWVNVDGVCRLRVCRSHTLTLKDNRFPKNSKSEGLGED